MKAGLEGGDEAAASPWIGVHEEGKKRPNVPAASFAATTSTNDCIILDINTIPEAAKIKMVLHMH